MEGSKEQMRCKELEMGTSTYIRPVLSDTMVLLYSYFQRL